MPHILSYPEPRQAPRLAVVVRDGEPVAYPSMSEECGTYRADDEDPPTAETPGRDITRSMGLQAAGLYQVIREHAREDGVCPLGWLELSEECGVTERFVLKLCKQMEAGGWLETVRRKTATGRDLPSYVRVVGWVNGGSPIVRSGESMGEQRGEQRGEVGRVWVNRGVNPHSWVNGETPQSYANMGEQRGEQPPLQPPVVNVPPPSQTAKEKTVNTPPKPPTPKPEPYSEGFDRFWAAYPRRDDRKGAEAIWARIKPDAALLEKMLAAIDRQQIAEREMRYRPMPTTWLNRERWNDEGGPPTNGTPNGHAPSESQTDMFARMKAAALRRAAAMDESDIFDVNGVVR